MNHKRRRSVFEAALAVLLASAAGVRGDEPALLERVGPASLRGNVTMEKGAVVMAFTDVLTLTIEVQGDANLDVRPPEPWIKGPWLARPAGPAQRQQEGAQVRWSQALQVDPLAPGERSLQLEPLRYLDAKGDWQTVAWQPRSVRITSKLSQAELENARDITAIEELPTTPPREVRWEIMVAAVVGAMVVVAALGLWWRRHRAARLRGTAEQWALYELQRLQALGLPERGKAERFGTLLTGLLRRYLEKKHHLPARRQTTGEFLATIDLSENPALKARRDFLELFLRRCDLLKFAPVTASVEECRALADQVSQFITQHQEPAATAAP
jgi:hypothetical protein